MSADGRQRAPAGIARSTAIFAAWTGVSRVAGLAREILTAALFGTQGAINAFVIAFQVPNLLRSLVADSALSAAFVPIFTSLQEQGRHRDAQRLAGALIGLITVVLGALTLLAIATAPWFVPLFAPGLPPDLVDEAVVLARIMFPIVVLLGLTGLVVAILQASGEFGASAFAPVLWNAVIIACLALVAPRVAEDDRITVYAIAIVVGTVVQLLYLLPSLRGKGPFPLALGIRDPRVRRVLTLMLPVTLGLGLINVNFTVDAVFATLVGEEAPRAIDAAGRLYQLPQGVFSIAIATVLFPTISRLAARRDHEGMRTAIVGGLRQIGLVLLPASAFLLALAEPVVRLVFQRGEFDARSTDLTSEALVFFAIGLTFTGAAYLVTTAFFSLQRPWIPTKVALLGVGLNAGLDAVLYRPLGVGGIPLATSLSSIATFVLLFALLERELGGLRRGRVLDGAVRGLGVAVLSAAVAWTVWWIVDDALGRGAIGQAASVGGAALAGGLAFAAGASLARMPELALLRSALRARR